MADEPAKARAGWLRLVHSQPEHGSKHEPKQLSLFLPGPYECQMAVVRMPVIGENEFFMILDQVQPAMVLDTRVVKRFDIGRLRRQDIFLEFGKRRIKYVEAEPTPDLDGSLSFSPLDKTLEELGNQPRRVLVFADGDEIVAAVREHFAAETVPGRQDAWAVRVLPAALEVL